MKRFFPKQLNPCQNVTENTSCGSKGASTYSGCNVTGKEITYLIKD